MDFSFELEGEVSRRSAFRERVRGLVARLDDDDVVYAVHDVSARGLALDDPQGRLEPGRGCVLRLMIGERTLISGLAATVVRTAGKGLTALAFGQISLRQEAWLDKLVLEIQKRRINLRKARDVAENLEEIKTGRVDDKT